MKNNKLYLLILISVGVGIIAFSYAFFAGFVSEASNTDVQLNTSSLKKLIFTQGEDLNLLVNENEFTSSHGSISASTTSFATLYANQATVKSSDTYNVYYMINNNEFSYTLNENTPEVILSVTDPDGNLVNTNDKLNYVEVTDYFTGNLIKGFDITTYSGLITIVEDYVIESTDFKNGFKQEWELTITFVNHNHLQNDNNGKSLDGNFILQENPFVILLENFMNEFDINSIDEVPVKNVEIMSLDNVESAGLYSANDNYGTTYYLSGLVDNNWVYFADFYWRIIRINGDNSVRLIYSGTTPPTEESKFYKTSSDTNIGNSSFAVSNHDVSYVGFKYTIGLIQGNENDSLIKIKLDNWFEDNLMSYSNYIADTIYCNDRRISELKNSYTHIYYSYEEVLNNSFDISCPNKVDSFTVNESTLGNGELDYPIALVNYDEMELAGYNSVSDASSDLTYLFNGERYWTMSPQGWGWGYSYLYTNNGYGNNSNTFSGNSYAVRPVISLLPNVLFLGSGTWDDPYRM